MDTKTYPADESCGQPPPYYPPTQGAGMHQSAYIQTNQYNNTTAVVGVQPTTRPETIIVTQTYAVVQPPNYLCLSCCTFWCINCIFGFIAFIFAMMSSSAFGDGRIEQARSHGKVALYLNIAGMVMTAILITVLLIMI